MDGADGRKTRCAQQIEDQHGPQHLSVGMREGSDEIKRLRSDLEYADVTIGLLNGGAELQAALAENTKLRAAVEEIYKSSHQVHIIEIAFDALDYRKMEGE